MAFTYRPATLDDCPAVVALLNACSQDQRNIDIYSESAIRSEWELPLFDLANSTRVAVNPDGEIVAYAEVWDVWDPPVQPFVLVQVHPEHENQGIGTALMHWAESRARQAITRVPADARVTMRAAAYRPHTPSLNLLTDCGMTVTRSSLDMDIELKSPPASPTWPPGIAVRTYDAHVGLRAVYDTQRAAFQDHRGYIAGDDDKRFEHWQHLTVNDPDYDPSLWFLALAGDIIAGIIRCKRATVEDPNLGWIDILGVRPEWRKQGVGLALLQHAFCELYARGMRRAALSVDGSSLTGATRLYEHAGMKTIAEYAMFEKELRPGVELTRQS